MGKKLIGTVPIGVSRFVDDRFEAGVDYYYSVFYSVAAYSQKFKTRSFMKNLWLSPKYEYNY